MGAAVADPSCGGAPGGGGVAGAPLRFSGRRRSSLCGGPPRGCQAGCPHRRRGWRPANGAHGLGSHGVVRACGGSSCARGHSAALPPAAIPASVVRWRAAAEGGRQVKQRLRYVVLLVLARALRGGVGGGGESAAAEWVEQPPVETVQNRQAPPELAGGRKWAVNGSRALPPALRRAWGRALGGQCTGAPSHKRGVSLGYPLQKPGLRHAPATCQPGQESHRTAGSGRRDAPVSGAAPLQWVFGRSHSRHASQLRARDRQS